MTFGQSLRQARERAGRSQGAFAAAVGIHRPSASLIERDLRTPRLRTVDALAHAPITPKDIGRCPRRRGVAAARDLPRVAQRRAGGTISYIAGGAQFACMLKDRGRRNRERSGLYGARL